MEKQTFFGTGFIGRIKKPIAMIVWVSLILLLVMMLFLRPRALALYHQVKGGVILSEVMRAYRKSSPNALACDLDPLEDDLARASLQQAISHLETARKYNPQLAQTYLLLGRAYCLMGEADNAVEVYEEYVALRPTNPLGRLELGFAYASECEKQIRESYESVICNLSNLPQSVMIDEGNQAFLSHQYEQAARWYQLTSLVEYIPESIKFRWSVAEIMLGHELTHIPDPPVLSVHELRDYLKINGSTLQWMLDSQLGKPIGNSTAGDPNIGYLIFAGEAIAAINVHQTSVYHITIRAQNSPPPPIQLQLEINFRPIANFELSRGDGSWEELSTEITLEAGLHILAINYLNDAVISGIDRNAIIEWVILSKSPPLYPH